MHSVDILSYKNTTQGQHVSIYEIKWR